MKKLSDQEKKYVKETFIIIACGVIINVLCFLLFFLPSKAASEQAYQYFPQDQNYNGYDFTGINGLVSSTGNINLDVYDYKLNICSNYQGYYAGWLILSDNYLYAEIANSGETYNIYSLGANWYCYEYQCGFDLSWCNVYQRDYLPSGCYSNLRTDTWDVVSNYALYSTNNPDTAQLVLSYTSAPPWITTAPNPFEPEPTDEPNTPPVKPTWDNDKTPIENIAELIKWLGDSVIYLFNNLKQNLTNWFSTLKKTIENGITTFYNNMESLFRPFIDKITQIFDYMTEQVNPTIIVNSIGEMRIFTDFTTVSTTINSFQGFFTDTAEPESFSIPVHLENITILNTGIQYIDLSVINPVKPVLRALFSAIVTFSLVYTILDSIPNYINGGGDE